MVQVAKQRHPVPLPGPCVRRDLAALDLDKKDLDRVIGRVVGDLDHRRLALEPDEDPISALVACRRPSEAIVVLEEREARRDVVSEPRVGLIGSRFAFPHVSLAFQSFDPIEQTPRVRASFRPVPAYRMIVIAEFTSRRSPPSTTFGTWLGESTSRSSRKRASRRGRGTRPASRICRCDVWNWRPSWTHRLPRIDASPAGTCAGGLRYQFSFEVRGRRAHGPNLSPLIRSTHRPGWASPPERSPARRCLLPAGSRPPASRRSRRGGRPSPASRTP